MKYRFGVAERYVSATLFALNGCVLTACGSVIDVDPRTIGAGASYPGGIGGKDDDEVPVDADPSTGGGAGAGEADTSALDSELTARSLSNEAIWNLVSEGKYRGEGFRRVDRTPFPSTVSPEKVISLWISKQAYDPYSAISPDASGSRPNIPVGTVIVREVLRGSTLDAITVMVKLPKGAFPLGGDFWFAAAAPDGTLRVDPTTHAPVIGLSATCGSCHLRRDQDGFLFGVPTDYQQ
jgi:hypothetical protein